MNGHLFGLAARRVWSRATLVSSAALLAVLWFLALAPTSELDRTLDRAGSAHPSEFADRLLLAACLCVPLAVWPAAQSFRHWRRGEIDWLASAAASPWKWLTTCWAGTGGAACALIAFALLLTAAGPGATQPVRERLQRCTCPAVVLGGTNPRWSVALQLEPRAEQPGARLWIPVRSVGAAPAATLFARARRQGARPGAPESLATESSQRVFAARHLELELPSGQGPVLLDLWVAGGQALVFLERDALLVTAGAGLPAWCASARLSFGVLVLVLAATALALGLGAWLRPATALCGVLALALAAELLARSWPALSMWLPWTATGEQWRSLRSGLYLAGWPMRALASTAACVVVGLALGCCRAPRWSIQP